MAKQLVDVSTAEINLDCEWPSMDNLESAFDQMGKKLRTARDGWNDIQTQMRILKHQGLIFAVTHWKAGVYLYLVYPSKNGEPRKREYIGKDEAKIKEALDGIQRGKDYLALEVRAERLQNMARSAWHYASMVHNSFA